MGKPKNDSLWNPQGVGGGCKVGWGSLKEIYGTLTLSLKEPYSTCDGYKQERRNNRSRRRRRSSDFGVQDVRYLPPSFSFAKQPTDSSAKITLCHQLGPHSLGHGPSQREWSFEWTRRIRIFQQLQGNPQLPSGALLFLEFGKGSESFKLDQPKRCPLFPMATGHLRIRCFFFVSHPFLQSFNKSPSQSDVCFLCRANCLPPCPPD